MVCPVCGFENLMGADSCANCGADLRTSDIPVASTPFERLLTEVRSEHAPDPGRRSSSRRPATIADAFPEAGCATNRRPTSWSSRSGRLVGIFTERDALLKLAGQAAENGKTFVRGDDSDPVVLRPDDSIAVAVQKMAVGGFRHIPLVADGRPLGVISAADVFRHILRIVG